MTPAEQFSLPMAVGDEGQASPRLALLPAQWLSEWGIFPPSPCRSNRPAAGRPIVTEFYKGTSEAYSLEIGGFNLMGPDEPGAEVRNNPSWTIDHFRVFAALVTFVSRKYYQPPVDISWRSLFARMGMPETPNRESRSYWRNVATEVLVTYHRVRRVGSSRIVTASIASNRFVKILFSDGKTVMGETIQGFSFRPEFLAALWPGIETGDRTQVRDLDQSTFASFALPLSRQLYLVLGKDAAYRSVESPYHCDFKRILSNCGHSEKSSLRAALRLRALCGRDKQSGSVGELDGAPLLNGRLRLRVRQNLAWLKGDGNPTDWDYVIEAWCEGRVGRAESLPLKSAGQHALARATGLSDLDYLHLCRRAGNRLTEEDVGQLEAAGFRDWKKSELFLVRTKAFLGVGVFHEEIGDTRMHRDSGRTFTKNPSARITDNLLRAVGLKAAAAVRPVPDSARARTPAP